MPDPQADRVFFAVAAARIGFLDAVMLLVFLKFQPFPSDKITR
jgi:hypothetical protein